MLVSFGNIILAFVRLCCKLLRKSWLWILFTAVINNISNYKAIRAISSPAGIYLLKVNNRNTRTSYEICPKLTIKTLEWRQWRRSGVFIVNLKHVIAGCLVSQLWIYNSCWLHFPTKRIYLLIPLPVILFCYIWINGNFASFWRRNYDRWKLIQNPV